jgi:hypothetical protein
MVGLHYFEEIVAVVAALILSVAASVLALTLHGAWL